MPTRFWLFVMLLFAFSASYFSLLAQRISNQKKCTPASAYFLRCSSKWASIETRPGKPHKTWLAAELKQPMAESSHFACALLGAADGDPEHRATATKSELNKKNLFFEPSKLRQCEFGENHPIPSR